MELSRHPSAIGRVQELQHLRILDTPREEAFDNLAVLAAEMCDAPVSMISLVDEGRHWFKAEVGLGLSETPIEEAICAHDLLSRDVTVIEDTAADPRTRSNALCQGKDAMRFYAAAPLITRAGVAVGALCVLDRVSRSLSNHQRRWLGLLADQAIRQIENRRDAELATGLLQEVDHRVKNSLGLVTSLLSLQARRSRDPDVVTALEVVRDRIGAIAKVHDLLHSSQRTDVVELGTFLRMLTDALASQARPGMSVHLSCASIVLPAREAVNAGLIVNELVTNALKHAYVPEGPAKGSVNVTVTNYGGRLRIVVADNGEGLPEGFDPATCPGLGMRLCLSLADQLGGKLIWSSDGGRTAFAFDIPLD